MTNDNCILELMEKKEFIKELNNYPTQVINGNLIALKYNDLNEVNEIYKTLKDNNITFYKDYTKENYGSFEFGIYDNNQNMILIIYKEY